MDIKMFFEFPGVLITIGVFLLVVSIVIGVIAYKNPVDDEEEIEDIKSKLKGKDEHHEEKEYTSEEDFLDKEVVEDNKKSDETISGDKEQAEDSVKTADVYNVAGYSIMLFMALAGIVFVIHEDKKKKNTID